MNKKKTSHYLDNKHFYNELILYKKDLKAAKRRKDPLPKIPETIGKCILDLCVNMGRRYNYARYTFKEDMIGDAYENCLRALDNFEPDIGKSPFSYFNMIAWRAFVRRIVSEEKIFYGRCVQYDQKIIENEVDNISSVDPDYYKYMKEFMISFEDKAQKKKEKKKQKQKEKKKDS